LDLTLLGWNSRLASSFEQLEIDGLVPARVIEGQRDMCTVLCGQGELLAEMSGRFRLEAADGYGYPVVGDWVAIVPRPGAERATLHAILPRAGTFVRRSAVNAPSRHTRALEQVVAANIDTAVIVMGLDLDYNPRRLERYLTLAWSSGAQPLVVLNKADLCEDVEVRRAETEEAAIGTEVLVVSAATGLGMDVLASRLQPARTAAFLGSSGVGKSSLVNGLFGEARMATGEVRKDLRGRHTTTHREMVILPSGAILIDNPGIREVGLWGEESDLDGSFSDIAELAHGCRFSDCRHGAEPGCAVQAALADGTLSAERFRGWRTLQRELAHLATRDDVKAYLAERRQAKIFGRSLHQRARKGGG
jgi:ribosome biogenesis GTPase / thiamine phosphate phosphatase